MAKSFSPKTNSKFNEAGQVGLTQILSIVILVFVLFTVGRVLFNATPLDPEAADGGVNSQGTAVTSAHVAQNSLMNIGLIVMSGIILIAAMASIVMKFF